MTSQRDFDADVARQWAELEPVPANTSFIWAGKLITALLTENAQYAKLMERVELSVGQLPDSMRLPERER